MVFYGFTLLLDLLPVLGYVSGGMTFLKPLNREEEQKCIEAHLKGDVEAKNKLIEHNMRLIAHIAKKYVSNQREMDDLISIGTIGLIKAVNTYDPDSGKPLGTYAARCIENEILMSIRLEKKRRGEVPMEEAVGADKHGNQVLLMELLGTPKDLVEERAQLSIDAKRLYEVVEHVLTKRERAIVLLRYGLYNGRCYTQKEIAKVMGISRSYVSRIEKKALSKLLRAME
ncbi:MAG: sigma-70 family RNA polymerase sigma factor [Clostridiales bacterium]|nr:sigma-70 family RNA polymerase sigma factor [Clostridiales bacterium]